MLFQTRAKHEEESRAAVLRRLLKRLTSGGAAASISTHEARLLEEAIACLEEKDARYTLPSGRKPKFLPSVIALSGAWIFSMPVILFWPTSIGAAILAAFVGLAAGVAAVKLDPGMKGYWLHDVD